MGLSSMYGGSGQTVYFLTLGFRRQPEVVWAELIWGAQAIPSMQWKEKSKRYSGKNQKLRPSEGAIMGI
jgi:hypothetical protein